MPETADENPARARILEAAITCIEREGIESVTSRSIAKQAGVNLAALNYYFGSKERVVELALAKALDAAFLDSVGDFERFLRRHGSVREAMVALLDETLEHAIRYPTLGFAVAHATLSKQRYDTPFVARLNEFLEQMLARVGPALRGETEAAKRASLAQLWSVVLVAGLMPRAFDRTLGEGLADPTARLVYVRTMVDSHFVAEAGAPSKAPRRALKRR